MAKLPRTKLLQFGRDGSTTNFAQFGSLVAEDPTKTKDIATIQALPAWVNGWQDAVFGSNRLPTLEDTNGLMYVYGYQLSYLMQEGVPEWQTDAIYFIGSIVKKAGTNELYSSITNDNTGQALPAFGDNANWFQVYPVRTSTLVGSISNSQISDVAAGKITGQLGDSQIAAIAASKVTGQIVNAQIQDVAATKITGTIVNAQINDVAASKITGQIVTAQIGDVQVTDAKIASMNMSKLIGSILSIPTLQITNTLQYYGNNTLQILQLVKFTSNSQSTITSTSFQNTTLSGVITLKKANSIIIVFGAGNMTQEAGDISYATLARDGSNLAPDNGGFHGTRQNNNYYINMITFDSPGGGAHTYSVQLRTQGGGGFARFPVTAGSFTPAGVLMLIELGQPT
jgi:hypothetical protein